MLEWAAFRDAARAEPWSEHLRRVVPERDRNVGPGSGAVVPRARCGPGHERTVRTRVQIARQGCAGHLSRLQARTTGARGCLAVAGRHGLTSVLSGRRPQVG